MVLYALSVYTAVREIFVPIYWLSLLMFPQVKLEFVTH